MVTYRTLWVVRHAEREDNVNRDWQRNNNPYGLKRDNTPLSKRGHHQCSELATMFSGINIDYLYASPFDRTVDTATRLLGGSKNMPIKAEPGFCEVLYLCEKPPSFEDPSVLKKRYPLVCDSYVPIFNHPLPNENYGDESCIPRVQKTLEKVLEKCKPSESIVIVTHACIVAAIKHVLVGSWEYVGQATVSKFIQENPSGKWRCELFGDSSHLSDKTNLRAY